MLSKILFFAAALSTTALGAGPSQQVEHIPGGPYYPLPEASSVTTRSEGVTQESVKSIRSSTGGTVTLENRCTFDLWLWTAGPDNSPGYTNRNAIHLPARGTPYSERVFIPDTDVDGGTSFKLQRSSTFDASLSTQFEYGFNLTLNAMYYDISFVNCDAAYTGGNWQDVTNCPAHKYGLSIVSSDKNCNTLYCGSNQICPDAIYYVDQPAKKIGYPEPVGGCGNNDMGASLTYIMCTDNAPLNKRSVAFDA